MSTNRSRRVRRLLATAAAVAVTCGLAAGCAGSDSPARKNGGQSGNPPLPSLAPGKAVATSPIQNVTVGFSLPATNMAPDSGGYGYYMFGQLSLEQLLVTTPDGKLQPWLATEWRAESPTEYVYTLRKGVKFWDGNELTADDVVYSLIHDAGPSLGHSGLFASVSGIQARDKHTVVVTLKQPDASWKYTPALFYSQIYEKKFAEQHPGTFGKPGTLVMGTGPWQLDSLDPTTGAALSANPHYWGGEPPIKHITVKLFSSDTSLELAMRAGQVDIAPMVTQPNSFESASGVSVTTAPTCATTILSMPTQTAPWDDVHVRRAVAYALDKTSLLKATGGANTGTLDTLFSPTILSYIGSPSAVDAALKSVPTYSYDVAKAKQELAQSSRPTGFSATLITSNDQLSQHVDQVIGQQLKKIGIDIDIQVMEAAAWHALIYGPADKRPLTFTQTGACVPDPSWDGIFLGSNGRINIANWQPASVDTLLAQGLATDDPDKRLPIYTEILKQLAADVPYVPLFQEGTSFASDKYDWPGFGAFWQSNCWGLYLKPR